MCFSDFVLDDARCRIILQWLHFMLPMRKQASNWYGVIHPFRSSVVFNSSSLNHILFYVYTIDYGVVWQCFGKFNCWYFDTKWTWGQWWIFRSELFIRFLVSQLMKHFVLSWKSHLVAQVTKKDQDRSTGSTHFFTYYAVDLSFFSFCWDTTQAFFFSLTLAAPLTFLLAASLRDL